MAIQSTGIGSGLDVNNLISKLMQVESQPLVALAKKEASFQAKLSAYGSLKGAVSAFQNSLTALNTPSTFQTLAGSSSDSTVLSASVSSVASTGSYTIAVSKLAQSQTISSAGQVSASNTIGDGTPTILTFQFGTIAGVAAVNGKYANTSPGDTTFTQDANQATGTVTINSTNNSLQGIRDAINSSSIGVSASIVGDGSATPYHLVLSSNKTGATSSLKISSSGGDGTIAALTNYDPTGVQNFSEAVIAQSANLTVNGINISSAANSVSGAIQGVTLNLTKVGSASVSVAANTSAIQTGVVAFVKAYNELNTTIKTLSGYDATTQKGGLLLGDSTTQQIQNQIRNSLSTAVNGLGGGLTTLSQIGISFQKDGSLSLDTAKLTTALSTSYTDVAGLFTSIGKASDSFTNILSSSSATQAGSYALNISQLATQAVLTGSNVLAATTTVDPATTLNVTLDGLTASVSLAAGTSYTPSQLATLLQTSINGTAAFSSVGSSLRVSVDGTNHLVFQSNKYGSTSTIGLTDGTGTQASVFSGTNFIGSTALNVAGSLNGISGSGSGQSLTSAAGTGSEGLKLLITGGAIGDRGTVNYSRGYAYLLDKLVTNFIGSSGTIVSKSDGINKSIADIGKQRINLNSHLFDVEARYRAQFTALDRIVSGLNNTSSFLTQQLSALTGTKNY